MKLLVATGSFTKQTIIQKWICFELVHGPSYVLACFVLIIIFNVFYAEIIRKGYFFCRSIFGCRTELPGFLELFIGKKVALSWISGFSHEVYIQNIVCCLWDVQKHCQNILTVVLGCKYNKVYTARHFYTQQPEVTKILNTLTSEENFFPFDVNNWWNYVVIMILLLIKFEIVVWFVLIFHYTKGQSQSTSVEKKPTCEWVMTTYSNSHANSTFFANLLFTGKYFGQISGFSPHFIFPLLKVRNNKITYFFPVSTIILAKIFYCVARMSLNLNPIFFNPTLLQIINLIQTIYQLPDPEVVYTG